MCRAASAGEQGELGVNEGVPICHAAELAGPEVAAIARACAEEAPQSPDSVSVWLSISSRTWAPRLLAAIRASATGL